MRVFARRSIVFIIFLFAFSETLSTSQCTKVAQEVVEGQLRGKNPHYERNANGHAGWLWGILPVLPSSALSPTSKIAKKLKLKHDPQRKLFHALHFFFSLAFHTTQRMTVFSARLLRPFAFRSPTYPSSTRKQTKKQTEWPSPIFVAHQT